MFQQYESGRYAHAEGSELLGHPVPQGVCPLGYTLYTDNDPKRREYSYHDRVFTVKESKTNRDDVRISVNWISFTFRCPL